MKAHFGYSLAIILSLVLMQACSKSELQPFSEQPMVYFYRNYFAVNDSIGYSFAVKPDNLLTDTVKLPVRIIGPSASKDRIINIKVIADSSTGEAGKHYQFLPALIKAGESSGSVPVLLKRHADLRTSEKRLMVEIIESPDFKPGFSNIFPQNPSSGGSLRFMVKWNDFLSKPATWSDGAFGTFSQVKYKFVIATTGRIEFNYSGTDPVSLSQMDYFKVLCRKKLAEYEAINGPMYDENNVKVTFP